MYKSTIIIVRFFRQLKTAYIHLGLTETAKMASVNVAEISIAASTFFNLDHVSKWVSVVEGHIA